MKRWERNRFAFLENEKQFRKFIFKEILLLFQMNKSGPARKNFKIFNFFITLNNLRWNPLVMRNFPHKSKPHLSEIIYDHFSFVHSQQIQNGFNPFYLHSTPTNFYLTRPYIIAKINPHEMAFNLLLDYHAV